MKLLFVNQHFGLDAPATGVLLHQLTHALAAKGHEISVLTGSDGAGWGRLVCQEVSKGYTVVRVGSIDIGDKSTLRRVLHYSSYFVLALWAGARQERPDAVVAMSTPPLLAPMLGKLLAWYHNVPYYYNIQDLYPDVARAAGKIPPWAAGLFERLAGWLERGAAGVSTVGKGMSRALAWRFKGTIAHVPNWADVEEIQPLSEEKSLRKLWGLEGKFVVLYSGNLGVCHDTEVIGDAVTLLRDQPIEFLFVVSPGSAKKLRALFAHHAHVHIYPYQPRALLPSLLATADAGLVSIHRGMSRFVVPCKTFGIMAAGKPLVAVSDLHDDLYEITHKKQCGVWAASGDSPGLARGILRLQQNRQLAAEMGGRGRRLAEAEYSVQAAVRNWQLWLQEVEQLDVEAATRSAA